jgi:von Willebrand factor type A domain/Aerotolerance regulator N-terminal
VAAILAFWQFGSVGMLAWGVAAVLPILIHLWSRRKYRHESWAAMAFLLAALQQNARRIQLEQWILLAVRTAILLLFALALADPQLSSFASWAGGATGGLTHVVLVLDGSYSMDYRQSDKPRFELAKEFARQLVSAGQQGDGYTLVVMGEPPRAVIAQPAFDKDDVIGEIDNLQLLHSGAALPATLAEIETILHRATERQPRLIHRRVCIFTDLQQSTWGEVTSAECRARLGRIETLAPLELVDLGQPGESNLAVARLEVESAAGLVAAGSEVQIQADIQSFGREDRPRQPVEVLVDGQRVADERVDCPAGGRTTITFPHRFDAPGEHIVELHLRDDALPLDNRRWLSVPVRDVIRVLCVGGRPSDTKHISLALAPRKELTQAIKVVEAPESRLLDADLSEFDCLFICNIGRFNRSEAEALHRFVSRGGCLIVFVGDQVQLESYNLLLADDPRTRVLPGHLATFARTDSYSLDPLDYRHPIVGPFRGFPQSGLLTTPVWKYVRIVPFDGSKTALAFDSGDPAIVECQVARGRCVLVATAASPDAIDQSSNPPTPWTALPTWPSFPPLVHEMLRYSLANRRDARNVLVGEELTGSVSRATAIESVNLTGPGGLSERLPVRPDDDELRWMHGPAQLGGVYEIRIGASSRNYAVNVNSLEGDLARFDPQLLPGQLRREPLDAADETAGAAFAEGGSYFRWLLGAVFGLLVIEPCLAWQFGRGHA